MKIGIITHHYINNYGAFLQVYALSKAIKESFPEAEVSVINKINRRHAVENTLGWFRFFPNRETPLGWLDKTKVPLVFQKARKEYLNVTESVDSAEDIKKMGFDAIVVGSDEVWNLADKRSYSSVKFGIGMQGENLVAYAPSVGQTDPNELTPEACEGLRDFKALSARDSRTENMLASLGLECTRVTDPTFLTELPYKTPNVDKPYILFYYCDKIPENSMKALLDFAKENGYKVYGAGENNKIFDKRTIDIDPFEWAGMFKNAAFVVTGTFHGVVFSMLNQGQFVCYTSNPSRREKVGSLLDEYGLEERRFENDTDVVALLQKPIDYDSVNKIKEEKTNQSKQYLVENIGKIKEDEYTTV